MKLLSCHIENFGTLHDVDLQFSDGLNTILRENGWGKSTLQTFLVVMFYGFTNERKRNLLENERRRFAPWQQGIYAGSLIFETERGRYRLERSFGTRDAGEDRCAVYDDRTNIQTTEFDPIPGEVLFQIDRASFERTICMRQQDLTAEATPGMQAKIGSIPDEMADLNQYEAAEAKLKTEMDRLNPRRKTGLLAKLADRTAELESLTGQKESVEQTLIRLQNRRQQLSEESEQYRQRMNHLHESVESIEEMEAQQITAEKYRILSEEEQRALRKVEKLELQFRDEIPQLQDVEELIAAYEAAGKVRSALPAFREKEEILSERIAELQSRRAVQNEAAAIHSRKAEAKGSIFRNFFALILSAVFLFGSWRTWKMDLRMSAFILLLLGVGILFVCMIRMLFGGGHNSDPMYDMDFEQNPDVEEEIRRLRSEERRMTQRIRKGETEIAETRERIQAFFESQGVVCADPGKQLRLMRDTLFTLRYVYEDLERKRQDRLDFLADHPECTGTWKENTARTENMGRQLKTFSERLDRLAEEQSALEKETERWEKELSGIEDAETELASLREQTEELQKRYEIVCKTSAGLKQAKLRFSEQYITPVQDAFQHYYRMITGENGNYQVNADLNLLMREAGATREISLLSSGGRDLVGLCWRMAMIEVMYKGEKPFLILDDPFVNLDDRKLQGAIDFLEKMGKSWQIIYFTCQSVRSL